MASDRRAYVKIPDAILREPWDDATLADLVRLQAFLNTRWARDHLTAKEAGRAFLGPQEMMLITHTTNVTRARRRLMDLPKRTGGVTLTVVEATSRRRSGDVEPPRGRCNGVIIDWPKFPKEQGYYDRDTPKPGGNLGVKTPLPLPQPLPQEEEEKESDASASGDAPHDPPQDHSRWLNLLTPPRGEKATDAFQRERTVWLEAEMTGIEANAEAMARTKGADWDDKRTRNSWVKTRLVAFWKQYLAGDRKYRDALRREKADATEARFRAEQKARPIKDDGTEAAVQRFLGVG